MGKGTTFRIYLSRYEEVQEEIEENPLLEDAWRGSQTILLVEDEEMVRNFARQVLADSGYAVLDAEDGEKRRAFAIIVF